MRRKANEKLEEEVQSSLWTKESHKIAQMHFKSGIAFDMVFEAIVSVIEISN